MKRVLPYRLKRELKASALIRVQKDIVRCWHKKESRIHGWEDACRQIPSKRETPDALPLQSNMLQGLRERRPTDAQSLVCEIVRINTFQWHEEDKARDIGATDSVIARVKRSIDQSNQRRVDAVEALDSFLEQTLNDLGIRQDVRLPLSSETPGSLVDRLSILVLKIHHMKDQHSRKGITIEQKRKFSVRLKILEEQLTDLSNCLDELIRDVFGKKRRFKTYFQLKMYNDPETNPYLRNRLQPEGRG